MSIDLKKGYTEAIIGEATVRGVLRNQLAYILATSEWETAYTQEPVKEAYWLSEDWRENNLRYYPWYGRGFVQLTWEENYDRAQQELSLGTQLTDDPEGALDPEIAKQVIVVGMLEGWFTGKKLADYITIKTSDFVNARRIINGTDHATDIASLAYDYDDALKEIGYGEEEEPEYPDQPELPVVEIDLEKAKKFVLGLAKTVQDLQERVEELERWRSS